MENCFLPHDVTVKGSSVSWTGAGENCAQENDSRKVLQPKMLLIIMLAIRRPIPPAAESSPASTILQARVWLSSPVLSYLTNTVAREHTTPVPPPYTHQSAAIAHIQYGDWDVPRAAVAMPVRWERLDPANNPE